ncbi:hypothetical protein [Chryseobacterium shigense]|uniref:Uncharacterized protein n=1 Tax=Chryseobacterium shigense TaxID=297244 RepID=A0A841MYR8_9FLAO|nr:hypothetical protein [Chryseobacterium shigense]MBB6369694.1 hypothetical protein [Chryseobacterium shigense]
MAEDIKIYLEHIKSVCPELTDAELEHFDRQLTTTQLSKGAYYIYSRTNSETGWVFG